MKIEELFENFLERFHEKHEMLQNNMKLEINADGNIYKIEAPLNISETPGPEKPYVLKWDRACFPVSEYHKKNLEVLEKYSEISIYRNLSKSAKVLTLIDISILKQIESVEVARYGKEECPNLNILTLKNKKLRHFVAQEISKKEKRLKFFFALAKKLKKLRNFNSMSCVIEGIRMTHLSNRNMKKVGDLYDTTSNYFVLRDLVKICTESTDFIIPPMDTVLKDIAQANIIKDSEVANMKFFKIISFFIRLQSQDFAFKSRLEVTWLCRLYNTECFPVRLPKKSIDISGIHLLL